MRRRRPRAANFADSLAARGIAALILVLVVLSLVWLHRHDLFPGEEATSTDSRLAACVAERADPVEKMLEDGLISSAQAVAMRARAIRYCEQTAPAE
jgi:hypothetical protein